MNNYDIAGKLDDLERKLDDIERYLEDPVIARAMLQGFRRDWETFEANHTNGNVPTSQPITVSKPVATKSSRGRPGVKTRAWLRIVKDAGPDGITNPEIRAKLMAEGFTIDPNWLSGQPSKWRNKGENIESYEGKYRWAAP